MTGSARHLGRILWVAAGLLLMLLAACLADGSLVERLTIRSPAAHRILVAGRMQSASRDWLPPDLPDHASDPALDDPAAWPDRPLPDVRPQGMAPSEQVGQGSNRQFTPTVMWYRIAIPTACRSPGNLGCDMLFPRFAVNGTLAIYLENRLIWLRPERYVFHELYMPRLIHLDQLRLEHPVASGQPVHLYVRVAARARNGSIVTAPWVAPHGALAGAYNLRRLLQSGIVNWTWAAYWLLGFLAIAIWWHRRRLPESAIYLRFAAMALLVPSLMMVPLAGLVEDVPEWILIWLSTAGGCLLTYSVARFSAEVLRVRQPLLERVGQVMGVGGAVAITLYCLSWGRLLPSLKLSDQLFGVHILTLLFQTTYCVRAGWLSRSRNGAAIGGIAAFSAFAAAHDVGVLVFPGHADDLSYMSFAFPGSLVSYGVYLFRNYLGALDTAESANENLQLALASKERELAEKHRQLMIFQNEQTISQERQRIMQEMHDGIGASLVSALHFVRQGERDPAEVAGILVECIDDLKLSIDSLEPASEDLLMLLASLRFRLGSRLQGSGIELDWAVADVPPLPWLNAQTSLHVLRILQEIMTNILKHSGASRLQFSTDVDQRDARPGVIVMVTDDGRPFQPPRAADIPIGRKGLGSILSRVKHLGGDCRWEPLERGNRFTLWLPLES